MAYSHEALWDPEQKYIESTVKIWGRKIARSCELDSEDRRDSEQELRQHLFDRLRLFDAERASRRTFIARVAENKALNMINPEPAASDAGIVRRTDRGGATDVVLREPGIPGGAARRECAAPRRSHRSGRRSRPGSRCLPTSRRGSPACRARRCSTASDRPSCSTSSSRTRSRADTGHERAPGARLRRRDPRRRRRGDRREPDIPGLPPRARRRRLPSVTTSVPRRPRRRSATDGCEPATSTSGRPTATGPSSAATAT